MSNSMFRGVVKNFFKLNLFSSATKPKPSNINNITGSNNTNNKNIQKDHDDDDEDGLDQLIQSTQSLIDRSKKVTELGDKYKDTMINNTKFSEDIKIKNQQSIQETIDRSMKELEERFNNIEFDANMNIIPKDTTKSKIINDHINSFQKRLDQLFEIAKEHIIKSTGSPQSEQLRVDFREKIKKLTEEIDTSTYLSDDLKIHFKNTAKGLEELDEESK